MFRYTVGIALVLAVSLSAEEPKDPAPPRNAREDGPAPVVYPRIHYGDQGPRITIVQTPAAPTLSQPVTLPAPYAAQPVFFPTPYAILPIPNSVFPTYNTLFPTHNTLFPIPNTLIPVHNTALPVPNTVFPSAPGRGFVGFPSRRVITFPRHTSHVPFPIGSPAPRWVPTATPRAVTPPAPARGIGIRKP